MLSCVAGHTHLQVNVHEMITAAAFSADGTRAVAGSYRGRLRFYEVEGAEGTKPKFEYVTQLDVKNTSNQKRGKKITGLQVSGDARCWLGWTG